MTALLTAPAPRPMCGRKPARNIWTGVLIPCDQYAAYVWNWEGRSILLCAQCAPNVQHAVIGSRLEPLELGA